jgi:hypothetical protein
LKVESAGQSFSSKQEESEEHLEAILIANFDNSTKQWEKKTYLHGLVVLVMESRG